MNQELIDANRLRVLPKAPGPAPRAAATGLAPPGQPVLDWLDRRLLDAYRRDFPVCETPFAEIASRLHCQASEVLRRFAVLERCGVVSRIGPVFAPGCIGASTLAAMAVPRARLESVSEWVNRYRAVSHTHEREHEFNLWFLLAAPNAGELYDTLVDIRRRTGLDVLDLRWNGSTTSTSNLHRGDERRPGAVVGRGERARPGGVRCSMRPSAAS